MNDQNENSSIDESLYSRQLYVLGHDAMRKMQSSNILICGLGGLGVEISKNIILAGVKSVTLHDLKDVSLDDLSSQFYLSENDLGKNRAQQSQPSLSELNSYVKVNVHTSKLNHDFLKQFQVVVCTDSNNQEQIDIGEFCHQNDIKFIVAETRGLFGKIFCDFGESFTVLDTNGEPVKSCLISYISNDNEGIVTTFEDQRHDLEDGSYVKFTDVKGMTELNENEYQIKVLSPYAFSIGDTSSYNKYLNGGRLTEVKKPKTIHFKSIKKANECPDYLITDYNKLEDNDTIHIAFQALNNFENEYGHLPNPWDKTDSENFVHFSHTYNLLFEKPFSNLNENLLKLFSNVCRGSFCPLQSVIGGISAQEVIKSCSGKFHPIAQHFYFDCREILTENIRINNTDSIDPKLNRYSSQIAIFGKDFQEKLLNTKCFLVGSGALGCEYLKNFAMLGLCCGKNGLLTVTDMDTIEKSNLNRQFLFRSWDIQKSKAEVASKAAKKMNNALNVQPNLNRVSKETTHIYNDSFFDSLDVVCNALDNIAARLYIDSCCVEFKKPLIESGTLGSQGNVQIILPHLTESYSSSQDPPEKSIPICTLKIFPNAIEHTLQWARDMFEGLFSNSAISALSFLKDSNDYLNQLSKLNLHQRLDELRQIQRLLLKENCQTFEQCVLWAIDNFQENFNHIISQLIFNFPPDHKTKLGLPFWSGPKRCPHPLEFDPNNKLHFDYIFTSANLKAFMHSINQVRDINIVRDLIIKEDKMRTHEKFKPKVGIKIKIDDSNIDDDQIVDENDEEIEIENITRALLSFNSNNTKLVPIEFEKDDDNNLHMDFITACSNLRAENYDISPADRHHSKLIAGRIIPAIATTTSVIVGLNCIELLKLVQGHTDLKYYKNYFINLALPFISSSEPMSVKKNKYYDIEWSLWDRIEVQGDLTIRQFLNHFDEKYKLKVTMIAYEVVTIYSDFISNEKLKERIDKKLTEVLEIIKKSKLDDSVKYLTLTLSCYDSENNDVDVPLVKYKLF